MDIRNLGMAGQPQVLAQLAGEKVLVAKKPEGEQLREVAEKKTVEKLQQRDRQVRMHEQRHLQEAGSLAAGAPTYTKQVGPDGNSYAIGGQVRVKVGTAATPEQTERNAARLARAATAPAHPSAQDLNVLSDVQNMRESASRQIAERQANHSYANSTINNNPLTAGFDPAAMAMRAQDSGGPVDTWA